MGAACGAVVYDHANLNSQNFHNAEPTYVVRRSHPGLQRFSCICEISGALLLCSRRVEFLSNGLPGLVVLPRQLVGRRSGLLGASFHQRRRPRQSLWTISAVVGGALRRRDEWTAQLYARCAEN